MRIYLAGNSPNMNDEREMKKRRAGRLFSYIYCTDLYGNDRPDVRASLAFWVGRRKYENLVGRGSLLPSRGNLMVYWSPE